MFSRQHSSCFDKFHTGDLKQLHLPPDTGHRLPSKKHRASPSSIIEHSHFFPWARLDCEPNLAGRPLKLAAPTKNAVTNRVTHHFLMTQSPFCKSNLAVLGDERMRRTADIALRCYSLPPCILDSLLSKLREVLG